MPYKVPQPASLVTSAPYRELVEKYLKLTKGRQQVGSGAQEAVNCSTTTTGKS